MGNTEGTKVENKKNIYINFYKLLLFFIIRNLIVSKLLANNEHFMVNTINMNKYAVLLSTFCTLHDKDARKRRPRPRVGT